MLAYPLGGKNKKRKAREAMEEDDEDGGGGIGIPMIMPRMAPSGVYSHRGHVYFSDDVSDESMFALCRELRQVATRTQGLQLLHDVRPGPIMLHITTNGGAIHAAFAAVDCIRGLGVPVHTVAEGFVASAGTLLMLAGERRFIQPNAYMLIHELRSGMWGKMSSIEEEYANLTKVMDHVRSFYVENTRMTAKQLAKILKQDAIWNADECVARGLVHEKL